jgi:hypothetical protein
MEKECLKTLEHLDGAWRNLKNDQVPIYGLDSREIVKRMRRVLDRRLGGMNKYQPFIDEGQSSGKDQEIELVKFWRY